MEDPGPDELANQKGAGPICAIFGFPVFCIAGCCLLAWNEKKTACAPSAIFLAADVQQVGCADAERAPNGSLVYLNCSLKKEGLQPLGLPGTTDFAHVRHGGVGLRVRSEMLLCVEEENRRSTHKDTSGGSKAAIKSFNYTKQWRQEPIDSSTFSKLPAAQEEKRRVCGNSPNPTWPVNVPKSIEKWVESAKAGDFCISDRALVTQLSLNKTLTDIQVPKGWTKASGWYTSTTWAAPALQEGRQYQLGTVRVRFESNDWMSPDVTVLGKNHEGNISQWEVGPRSLCSGHKVGELRNGRISYEKLFWDMRHQLWSQIWIFRTSGFVVVWFAFALLLGPLEVAACCLPACMQKCFADQPEVLTCCASFLPALACTSLVTGIVWTTILPKVGVPLLIVFGCLILWGLIVAWRSVCKAYGARAKVKDDTDTEPLLPHE